MGLKSSLQLHEPKACPGSSAARSAPGEHRLRAVLGRHAAVTHLTQSRPGFASPASLHVTGGFRSQSSLDPRLISGVPPGRKATIKSSLWYHPFLISQTRSEALVVSELAVTNKKPLRSQLNEGAKRSSELDEALSASSSQQCQRKSDEEQHGA
jgi:hypothetical protein